MKEMSRLAGCDVRALKDRRMDILKAFGDRYPAVCVLKDSRTAVYETGRHPFVNLAGNSAMAKGGAGDVLAGVITGFSPRAWAVMRARLLEFISMPAAG